MHVSNTGPRSASYGQALAAAGIIVFLALTVPLFGVLMFPVVVVATLFRTVRDDMGIARKARTLAPRA